MDKKAGSIILLCVIIVSFIFTAVILVNTGISFYEFDNATIDTSNDKLPGASIVGAVVTSIALWIGFIFLGGGCASVGFICSLVNTKIAENTVIGRISKAFLYFYSAVLIFILFVVAFCAFSAIT